MILCLYHSKTIGINEYPKGGVGMERSLSIQSNQIQLTATLHYPTSKADQSECCRWPLIIVCHGFVGNRIGVDRLFVKAARDFASHGYMVLRFDYAGCGESGGDYGDGGLDSLIAQTRDVINYGLSLDCVDPSQITLLGHSLGGGVAVLTAAQDPRVKSLILWSPVAYPFKDIVQITGDKSYETAHAKGAFDYLGYAFKPRFFDSLSAHNPLEATRSFKGDVYILHGSSDLVIPSEYCFLYQRLFWMRPSGQCDKDIIMGADHTYSTNQTSIPVIEKSREWLLYTSKRKNDWNDWVI